jgi:Flp pilus assembly protein TadD
MTDWLSATAMILSGGIVGFMFWYGMKGRKAAKPDMERLDLEAKRDVLLQQLREMKETGGSADEQRRLERETAGVLRALDKQAPDKRTKDKRKADSPVQPSDDDTRTEIDPRAVAAHARAASIRGFVWGVLSVAVLGGIAWFVTQQATPKTAGTTGGTPMTSATQSSPQQPDVALQQIQAAVARTPDDLEMRSQLAKAYFERENMMGVFQETQYILQRKPNDARALTYQALVRMQMGQRDGAEQMLNRALKADPELLDAYVALAWDYVQTGKVKEADGLIADASRRHPDQQARLEDVLAKMKEQVKNQPPPAAIPNHPALPIPGAESAPASAEPAPVAAGGASVHVKLSLAGSVKQSPAAVLFIIVRASGEAAGPPAAAKRINAPTFPMELDLTSADSMMGQPLPPSVTIEARLDSDGDAMTKDPSDPHASQSGVATNGTKVALVLK